LFYYLTGNAIAKNSETDMIPDFFDLDAGKNGIEIDDIIRMALAYDIANSVPEQYSTANADSDNGANLLNIQPGIGGDNSRVRESSLEEEIKHWMNPEKDELTLELRMNNQIHYIFITDVFGKIWFENEVNQFQRILKIDTNHLPLGSYSIFIENDGSFFAKRFQNFLNLKSLFDIRYSLFPFLFSKNKKTRKGVILSGNLYVPIFIKNK